MKKTTKGSKGTSGTTYASPPKKRNTPSDDEEDADSKSKSKITTVEIPSPLPKKQRKFKGNEVAITAAVYSAMLPCLDLIDPLMEFTRACSSTKPSSTKRKIADAQEQKVRTVVDALRERFENPPAPRSPRVVFNEHGEAEVLDSEEEEEEGEEEETELTKPRKQNKLNVILTTPGGNMSVVEVYKGTVKPSEIVRASKDGEQVKSRAGKEGKKKTGESAKKPKKRQTEVERLGGPVHDEPRSRRTSKAKAPDSRSLNRTQDIVDEAVLAGQYAADEDIAGA